jgi:hypothetical protein
MFLFRLAAKTLKLPWLSLLLVLFRSPLVHRSLQDVPLKGLFTRFHYLVFNVHRRKQDSHWIVAAASFQKSNVSILANPKELAQ